MRKKLKCCPVCGGNLEVLTYYQRTYVYGINPRNGTINQKRKRVEGDYPEDIVTVKCADCDFGFEGNGRVDGYSNIRIYSEEDYYEYEEAEYDVTIG